jgi:hypothetical protein
MQGEEKLEKNLQCTLRKENKQIIMRFAIINKVWGEKEQRVLQLKTEKLQDGRETSLRSNKPRLLTYS